MESAWDFALHVFTTMPAGLRAMLLGWALAITVTQPLKFLLPLRWEPATREMLARIVAFLVACSTVCIAMPTPTGLALGIIVGVWAPFFYWLLLRVLGDRWPRLRDALSGDVRGVLLGRSTENRP